MTKQQERKIEVYLECSKPTLLIKAMAAMLKEVRVLRDLCHDALIEQSYGRRQDTPLMRRLRTAARRNERWLSL